MTHHLKSARALVVGIANYRHVSRLPPTVLQDARDIHDLLADPQHCGYPPGNVQLLLDGAATQATIRQALANLAAHSDLDSTVFCYVSSHGGRIESGPCAGEYLLPVDAAYTLAVAVAQTAISGSEFIEALRCAETGAGAGHPGFVAQQNASSSGRCRRSKGGE